MTLADSSDNVLQRTPADRLTVLSRSCYSVARVRICSNGGAMTSGASPTGHRRHRNYAATIVALVVVTLWLITRGGTANGQCRDERGLEYSPGAVAMVNDTRQVCTPVGT